MNDEFDNDYECIDEAWTDEDFQDEPTALAECPNCGSEIYDDAVSCPLCGEYIIRETNAFTGKPTWYIALALAGILAVIVVLSGMLELF